MSASAQDRNPRAGIPVARNSRESGGWAWPAAVWAGSAVYAVAITAKSVVDHSRFRTGVDTAVYDQLLWLLANGHDPFSTVLTRPFLGAHFEPALVLLTPLYWLDLGIPGIFAAQSIALALTAPALFALARDRGASPALAAIPAFLWLVCPWVASANLFEFRPDPFVPVLLVLSVLFAFQGRTALFAATMLLAFGLKEDVTLTYAVLGLLLAYHGSRRLGLAVTGVSLAWFAGATLVMRAVGGGGGFEAYGQRWAGDRGDSIPDALGWALTHPLDTVSDIASHSVLGLAAILLATAGLALLAPSWLWLAAPPVAYNVLSAYDPQHDLVHHYHLSTVTAVFVAAAIGVPRVTSLGRYGRDAVVAACGLALVLVLVGGARVHTIRGDAVPLDADSTKLLLERIPEDVPVAATRTLLPHLSQREDVWTLPEPFIRIDWGGTLSAEELAERAPDVDWVAYAKGDQVGTFYTGRIGRERSVPDMRPLLPAQGFEVVARSGTVEILARRP